MFTRRLIALAAVLALCLAGVAEASHGAGPAPSAGAAKAKPRKCKKPKPKPKPKASTAAAKTCKGKKPPPKKPGKKPPTKPKPPPKPPTPPPPPPAETPAQAAQRATGLLSGGRFTRFAAGFDQRVHLCTNGRFIYDTVGAGPDGGDPDVRRTEGTWSVEAASSAGNVLTARVRGLADGGQPPLVVTFRYDGQRVTVDGNLWIAERSDLCA